MNKQTKFFLGLVMTVVIGISFGVVAVKMFSFSHPTESNPARDHGTRTGSGSSSSATTQTTATVAAAGSTFETTVTTDGVGKILVQVELPNAARYATGAPVVVYVPTFFTPDHTGFSTLTGMTNEGAIMISLMYPGRSDNEGNTSEGTDDYGGADSIKALRDVTLFALGEKTNSDGHTLAELSAITPLSSDVGLYAFSHPGIAAMAALGTYANDLKGVAFFVGRENPTLDLLSTLELGHWESKTAVKNPLYSYPRDYSDANIDLDYSSAQYDAASASPYFDTNKNKKLDAGEFSLGTQVPKMFDKRYYSSAMLHALQDNGALTTATWPNDLVTPEEADTIWPARESQTYYPMMSGLTKLHAMLVFSVDDHVQVVTDKPHIHQAYDGLRAQNIWVRLNPDASYMTGLGVSAAPAFTEHGANAAPSDWSAVTSWAFTNNGNSMNLAPVAGVLEMADRTFANDWSTDLTSVLTSFTSSASSPHTSRPAPRQR